MLGNENRQEIRIVNNLDIYNIPLDELIETLDHIKNSSAPYNQIVIGQAFDGDYSYPELWITRWETDEEMTHRIKMEEAAAIYKAEQEKKREDKEELKRKIRGLEKQIEELRRMTHVN